MSRSRAILLLYAVLAIAALGLTATEAGLRWAWSLASPFLPEKLTVTALHGRLLGPLRLEGLEYRDEARWLRADHVEWDWHTWRLITGMLDVTYLRVRGLHYEALVPRSGELQFPAPAHPPLELRLREVELQDLKYVASTGEAPRVIERFAFRASTSPMGLHVQDIQLQSGKLRVEGSGRIRLRGDYPLNAELRGQWSGGTRSNWQGSTELSGSLRALDLNLALLAPQPAEVTGKLRWLDDRVELDGQVETAALGGWMRWLELPEAGAESLSGNFRASYLGNRLRLEHAELRVGEQAPRITLNGEMHLEGQNPRADLQLQWQALRWPLQGEPSFMSPAGELNLAGDRDAYRWQANTSAQMYGVTASELLLEGTGGRHQLKLDALDAQLAGGVVSGQGRLDWSDEVTMALQLDGRGLDRAEIHPEWPGRISFESRVQASWPEEGLQLQVERAALRSEATRLSVQGRYGSESDLRATLDSPNLSDLLPGAAGKLQGSARWRGTRARPQLSAEFKGRDLKYEAHSFARLELDAELDGRDGQDSRLAFRLGKGRFSGIEVESLSLSGEGRHAGHAARLDLKTALGDLHLVARGKWTGGMAWQASLQSGEASPAGAGRWQLAGPVDLQLGRQQAALGRACWVNEDARACLQGEWSPGTFSTATEIERMPLAILGPYLPPGFSVAGLMNASGTAEQTPGAGISGQAVLALSEGEIRRGQPGGRQIVVRLQPSRAELRLVPDALDVVADLGLAPEGEVKLDLQLPWPLSGDGRQRPLQGQVHAHLPNLDFVPALWPELDDVSGRLDGTLRIAGTVDAPRGEGDLRLSDGALRINRLGLQVETLDARLQTDGRDRTRLDARARSGGGDLILEANSGGGLSLSTVDATLRGTDVLVYNDPDARVHVSPDLKIRVRARDVNISGEVHVPRAEITPRQYARTGAVTTSPDEVLVDADDPADPGLPGWTVHSRIRLVLGDEVHFDGLGLKADLAGDLLLQDEPGELTTASGELRVTDGSYLAYGQELDITTGRLLFNGGPLVEPAVDARAERKPVENVRVGVQLRGPLKSPKVSLFSDPPMSDSERLSYLMFGTPLDSSAGARNVAITQAAYALGLSGGETLIQDIGTQLGADEVSIQSGESGGLDSSRLVIGKYLSSRLYIGYGIGLFDAVRTLRLRYQLSPRWTLEGESGTHSGGDLLYSIER